MKKVRTVLAVASLMVIFSLIWSMTPTSTVSAQTGQPYMGGYFDYSY